MESETVLTSPEGLPYSYTPIFAFQYVLPNISRLAALTSVINSALPFFLENLGLDSRSLNRPAHTLYGNKEGFHAWLPGTGSSSAIYAEEIAGGSVVTVNAVPRHEISNRLVAAIKFLPAVLDEGYLFPVSIQDNFADNLTLFELAQLLNSDYSEMHRYVSNKLVEHTREYSGKPINGYAKSYRWPNFNLPALTQEFANYKIVQTSQIITLLNKPGFRFHFSDGQVNNIAKRRFNLWQRSTLVPTHAALHPSEICSRTV